MSNWIPNSFQLPNIFVDEAVNKLSPTACVLYIVIVRKTRGWQKNKDAISLTQFEKITGMSRKTVIRGLDELVSCDFVKEYTSKIKGSTKCYSLNDGVFSTLLDDDVVENLHQHSGEIPPVPSGEIPHTKTTNKTTLKNNNGYSEAFESFWSEYPSCKRKGTREAANKTFKKYEKDFELIMKVLSLFKVDEMWTKNGGQFISAPSAWLNAQHWKAEYWLNMINRNSSSDTIPNGLPLASLYQKKPKSN